MIAAATSCGPIIVVQREVCAWLGVRVHTRSCARLWSRVHWQKVDGLSSLPSGYGRIGRISPIIHERVYNLALTRHEEAKSNWKKFKWNVIKSHELVSPDAAPYGLIHDTLSARIFPSKACASLAQACSFMGVEFRENTYVSNFDTGVISGPWGNETASSIIIAT